MESSSPPESSSRRETLDLGLGIDHSLSVEPTIPPRRRFALDIGTQRPISPFALGSVLVDSHIVDAKGNQTIHPAIREVGHKPTTLKVGDEDLLREKFCIPPEIGIRIPGPNETVVEPPDGEISFFTSVLKLGVSIPFPDFICHFFRYFHLCPVQLALNGWRLLLGALVLSELNIEPLVFSDIRAISTLKENKSYGYYVVMPKAYQVTTDLPDTNKGWQDEYVFLTGEVGDIPKRPGLIRKPFFLCRHSFIGPYLSNNFIFSVQPKPTRKRGIYTVNAPPGFKD